MKKIRGKSVLLCLAALPLVAGCASQETLKQYQDEVTQLREERTRLKKENRELEMQLDDYAVALAEANAQRVERPQAPSYPDLDALGVGYGQRDGNMYISIPSEITFASGKAEVTTGGREALAAVARTLEENYDGGVYWIEGHTDSDPIKRSKWRSNRELSYARAEAVLYFLVEEYGLADDRCVVAAHGQYRPLVANDSKANKALNRRVEIVVRMPQG